MSKNVCAIGCRLSQVARNNECKNESLVMRGDENYSYGPIRRSHQEHGCPRTGPDLAFSSDQLEIIHPSDYKEKAASVSPIWPYAREIPAFSLKPSTG